MHDWFCETVNKPGRLSDPISNSNSRMGFEPESSKSEAS